MFTGIVEAVGNVRALQFVDGDVRVNIVSATLDVADLKLGDSIAVNGVCLTAVECLSDGFVADVSRETLALTTWAHLQTGAVVNLEKALRAQDRLGGHIVSGHVDGIAEIKAIRADARAQRFSVSAPQTLLRYISQKGSVTIDGVSLTVNALCADGFELCIVPHTLAETIFSSYRVGSKVNLEVDVIARYLERLLQFDNSRPLQSGLSEQLLREHGFIQPE